MTHKKTQKQWKRWAGTVAALSVVLGAGTVAAEQAPSAAHNRSQAEARPRFIPLPDAEHFVRRVTNPYLPWKPGTTWIYRGFGSEGRERTVVKVLRRTKQIQGIDATVVRDVVRSDRGRLIERTFDWYAQDSQGRVWYLGENTHAYERGQVSTEGSWQTGVDGARAGIAMFAHPRLGVRYWQEFYRGVAEDQGRLLAHSTQAVVPAGHFHHLRMTQDTTPLEPHVNELKFYAPRVGVVLEIDLSPEQGRVTLVRVIGPPRRR